MSSRNEISTIKKSGLFDAHYYLRQYPDVRRADIDPLMHYIKFGWKEGRNPGPSFDTNFYLESNPDVRQKNINPLFHYIRYGIEEGRSALKGSVGETSPVTLNEVAQNIPEPKIRKAYPTIPVNLKRLPRLVFRGLYFLRVNGFNKFITRVYSTLGINRAKPAPPPANNRVEYGENPYKVVYSQGLVTSTGGETGEYVDFIAHNLSATPPLVKLIAFYLPQFYPFPENDLWWGRGFTEWTNVSKAVPQFIGHYQPRLPGELGFYDLRLQDVQRRQVELAKNYGIYGFCFHYYWFNGKRLLDKPLDQFIDDPQIDFPFCICWANENWTRKWDGRSSEILISQEHSFDYDKLVVHDFVKLFSNPRYIRVDGRPLLIVYRSDILRDAKATLEYWRKYSIVQGTGDPYIVMAQTFGCIDPRPDGFDAAVEFPPHNGAVIPEISNELTFLNNQYQGNVYRYSEMVSTSIERIKREPYPRFNTVSPGWDNDSRRPGNGLTFTGSTPDLYARWLDDACRFAISNKPESERVVFINAWNEWAEAAYIEPDRKFGYAYLQATTDVADNLMNKEYRPSDQVEIRKKVRLIDSLLASCVVPESVTPLVSIIIPVYNHFDETLNCLKSIQATHREIPFEIIIIDDGSTDETYEVLSNCKRVRYIRNEQNLGFLKSCNKAVEFTSGQYLVFLNNDTLVQPGWLDTMMDTFKNYPGTGLVGSKLIYPDGRLQEAGGLMWQDANGINFGPR